MHAGVSLWIFIVTITALACTPGMDTVYVVTRGIGEGRRTRTGCVAWGALM